MNSTSAAAAPAHRVFENLVHRCSGSPAVPVAVVAPMTDVAMAGAAAAAREGIIEPLLVGPEKAIRKLAESIGLDVEGRIVDAIDDVDAARQGVALCRSGRARALMKGSLHTDTLLHAVLDRDSGLRGSRRVSHVFVLDAVPAYPRPLLITDAAVNVYPTLEDKVDIVRNAIDLAHALAIEVPHVALLSATETVNPKITSTLDAAALCKMADRKQITGAILDGPLAFDTAVSAEAARIKDLQSPVAGVADILVVPDLESGNMLAKQLEYLGGAELAGVVIGARVPIILTSRADLARARLASCAVAACYAHATARERNEFPSGSRESRAG
jgi:phosphate acetyltransferase